MGNKTRHTANLVSDNNLFVDIANDRVGIGSTQPTAKLNVAGIVSATSFRGDGSQLTGISVDSTSLVDSNSTTRVQANAAGAVVTGILTATKLFGDASNVTGIVTTNLGKANVTISDNPPGIGTAHGDLWWESDTAKGHIYYNDGSSAQWVEFTPSSGGSGGGGGGSYGNADVDSHLNISGASAGEILSWNGSDYAWVADQTGGGGGGSIAGISTTGTSFFNVIDTPLPEHAIAVIGAGGTISHLPNFTYENGTLSVQNTGSSGSGDLNVAGEVSSSTLSVSGNTTLTGNAEVSTGSFNIGVQGGYAATITNAGVATFSGSVTAPSFSGSGANLTNLPATNVTGNLNGVTDITCNSIINNAGGGATWALYNGGNANFTSSVTASSFVKSGGTSSQYLMADGSVSVGAGSTNLVTTWTLGANGSSDYTFTGPGVADGAQDPTIYLVRGQTYKFENRSGGHPFRIQYEFQNTSGTAYNDGIVNNAANHNTDLYWEVRNDAPDLLHYQCTAHQNMSGRIVILGDVVGSGSWTASAGTPQTIDTITGVANNAIKTAEYTIHIENGSNMQAQKVLVMQDGTTAYSQEYAIMHKSGLLVSMSATISGGNLLLQATPETGVSGTTTYKVTRQTMR